MTSHHAPTTTCRCCGRVINIASAVTISEGPLQGYVSRNCASQIRKAAARAARFRASRA